MAPILGVMTTLSSQDRHYALVTETWRPQINGVANTLGRLCDGLLQNNNRLQLVRPAQPGETVGLATSGLMEELLVRGLPIPGYSQLQFGLPAYRRLLAHWRNSRPDTVYLATEGPLGWSALRAARRLGIPVISGFHTNFQQYSEHYRISLLYRPVVAYLRWFHNQTLLTLTASTTQQRELSRLGINNLMLLGRGVDCELFHPAHRDTELRRQWGAGNTDIVLLHVGRLAAEKNLQLLQHSWQNLRENPPAGTRLHMVVVGDGPLRQSLEKNMPGAYFTGALSGTELATVYASADVFVFPSLTETFGNVVTEAMASGLAVNAFDTAAAHQHIRDRYSGCLAPPAHEELFLDNLRWLVSDAEGRRGIRMHARHRACQLGWPSVLQRFEGYLQRCCHPPRPLSQAIPGK